MVVRACEATLYEFVSPPGSSAWQEEQAGGRRRGHEVLAYLRRWRPEFEVRAAQFIALFSKPPLD